MTAKEKQCYLFILGYDPGPIDGIDGKQTQAALAAFKADYGLGEEGFVAAIAGTLAKIEKPPDTAATAETGSGDWWDDIQYFARAEFRCQCGGAYCNGFPVEPDEQLVRVLDQIRRHFGVPITISSGIRCATHNAEVGGVANSQHLLGTAADILVPGQTPDQIAAFAETLMPNTGGIGKYKWGCHIDSRATKARWDYR